MKQIEIEQYSMIEMIDVDSDWQRAEDEFYAQWRADIDEAEL